MIKNILLKNFKLFKETSIPLSNLNLLTGINGRGKSTVLQSLLLMKQSPEYDRTTTKIIFNGGDVQLGGFKDIKNSGIPNDIIEMGFVYDDFDITYQLKRNDDDPMVADIFEIKVSGNLNNKSFDITVVEMDQGYDVKTPQQEFLTYLYDLFINDTSLAQNEKIEECKHVKALINFSKVHYVSADRVGPKIYYEDKSLKDFYTVGSLGEDTVNILYHKKDEPVNTDFIENIAKLFHVATEELGRTVDLQTQFWLDRIFIGAKFAIKPVDNANLLTFTISPDGTSNYFKPTNVGYGFSYVLPIIVAGLIARSGEILIVENPEAHLHPRAQSVIAKFLTLVSLKGVQVIIESHSEHILNGLRIPIYEKVIQKNHLNVLYFDRSFDSYFKEINIDQNGGIDNWPPDFFDQSTKDLNHLFGV